MKEMLYTADMLREEFREGEILRLEEILTRVGERISMICPVVLTETERHKVMDLDGNTVGYWEITT